MKDLINRETAKIVFKHLNNRTPDYLSHLFLRNSERSTVNLRNADTNLLVPYMKISNGQKAFAFRGARVWNHLSRETKQAPSLFSFNKQLETYFW